jgi:hypothetical protein
MFSHVPNHPWGFQKIRSSTLFNVSKKFETLLKAAGLLALTVKILRRLDYPLLLDASNSLAQLLAYFFFFFLTQRNREGLPICLNPC